jgi:hypothetical protein
MPWFEIIVISELGILIFLNIWNSSIVRWYKNEFFIHSFSPSTLASKIAITRPYLGGTDRCIWKRLFWFLIFMLKHYFLVEYFFYKQPSGDPHEQIWSLYIYIFWIHHLGICSGLIFCPFICSCSSWGT